MKFQRGYQSVRDKVNKSPRFSMSCGNCASYYQSEGDTEECCQDPSVLEYDMVVEDTRVYCIKWKPLKGGRK